MIRSLALGVLLIGSSGDLVAQASVAGHPVRPVLDFPEPGVDDTAAYQGYKTRFYRDSEQNTVQIYLEPRSGRVVTLWADAANESIGFTARDARGRPARLTWASEEAEVALLQTQWVPGTEPRGRESRFQRTLEYHLTSDVSRLDLGWFVLGSMRIERDFQYAKRHLRPYAAPPFRVAEESLLVADVARLPAEERERHLQLLHADSVADLRMRLLPIIVSPAPFSADTAPVVRIFRPSLDNRNTLTLELHADTRETAIRVTRSTVSLRSRSGSPVHFTVRVLTNAAQLTPLQRSEIFNPAFLTFLSRAAAATDSAGRIRYRRMERQVRGVELLSSKEKLMAGLPNFATYFGRDMMMTALMMQPIWTAEMSEHVIASVLRKLGPNGDVSHEEALGGQAIRENAVVYDSLIRGYFRAARPGRRARADSLLEQARPILGELQKTRENYHMIDDEFQLPVLSARYLGDPAVRPERKRAFLLDSSETREPRLALMLREMALVTTWTAPYVQEPRPANLVSFPKRDATHWRSASWRDSDAGYAGGRFAMDVNAIWAPQALQSIGLILDTLPKLGITREHIDSIASGIGGTPLAQYLADPASLDRAIETWKGARRHFEVTLGPVEVQRRVRAKLSWLPLAERRYWLRIMAEHGSSDSLSFLALSLDAAGKPIPVVNTDPATGLFLGNVGPWETVLRDVAPFALRYPAGLLVDSLGPLVANDAYASREVWERFRADTYHSPRVVWGREVNLLFLGLANLINSAVEAAGRVRDEMPERVGTLQDVLRSTTAAVEASGLGHNELWSYRIEGGHLLPMRYGTSSDLQLWNTTDLAVEFVLSGLPASEGPRTMLTPQEREAGWRLLFDGSTTSGWRGYRKDVLPAGWQVIDGALTRVAPAGDIVTVDRYGNFELSLEWRVAKGGNSGIFYRVSEDLEYPWQSGPEMQVLDDAAHPDGRSPLTSAGALYGIYPATRGVVRPAGKWNAVRLVVNGNHVEHWLNGVKVVETELGSPEWQTRVKASKFATMPRYGRNHSGHIGLQDHGDRVSFRNIKIRVLP